MRNQVGRPVYVITLLASTALPAAAQSLPPPPVPPENPITEAKRILGKVLFWDEQLSSDNAVACGTCHRPAFGGADPRNRRHPGLDDTLGTPDDVLGSPGVIRCDPSGDYTPDATFDLTIQGTRRTAQAAIFGQYAPELFWDGRASSTFTNPETGQVSIPVGGGLESQAIGPILNDVEMAHEGRDWAAVSAKLAGARPLALATDWPQDVADALETAGDYPALFAAAFGDPAITAERIAFAIATYERTLVANQTPWDRFVGGDPAALTPQQQQGLAAMQNTTCLACHTPPMFTNNSFRNVGLRPVAEDRGRQEVTGNPADRGRFKVPTLRNVGLKRSFMHNGQLATLGQVFDFYLEANGQVQFPDNQDPLVPPIAIPPQLRPAVIDFLANGLTDPRVATETFPFDRPTLHSEREPNPLLIGTAVPGAGGIAPVMIAVAPPNVGNSDFKIGVDRGLGGAIAHVALSYSPPVGGVLTPDEAYGPITLTGSGAGEGYATLHWPIPDDESWNGRTVFMQWWIEDAAAADGLARSPIARIRVFCTTCACAGDLDGDGEVALADLSILLANYGLDDRTEEQGELTGDQRVDLADLSALLQRYGVRCQ
ncbi:MAG: hypothetical protein HRF50_06355 [Phycisphaerae bacterium]|jgi:cytochrome c peroxidase